MNPITLNEPEAYFARLAEFERNHWWSASLWKIAENWLDQVSRSSQRLEALDIGCGAGLTLARLASRPEIGRVVGIEPSPEAIARARGRGDFLVVEGSALNLPFRANSFDVVTCLDVLQHLPPDSDRQAASEIERILDVGGVAIVRTNAEGRDLYQLRQIFESSMLEVVSVSYVNLVGSLIQEVRGRIRPSKFRPHPSGGGLPTSRSRGEMLRAMAVVGRIEAYLVGQLGMTLPFGHSIMLLARKNGSRSDWPSRPRLISGRNLANEGDMS